MVYSYMFRLINSSHPPLQQVKVTQGQKPVHHCVRTEDHTRKTETGQDETNLVTGYTVTLTEKDQVDKLLNRENTSKGNTTTT
jgi:hypothetical protein